MGTITSRYPPKNSRIVEGSMLAGLTAAAADYTATGKPQTVLYTKSTSWTGVTVPLAAGINLQCADGPTEAWLMCAFRPSVTADLRLHLLKSTDGINFVNLKAAGASDHVYAGNAAAGLTDPSPPIYYRGTWYVAYTQLTGDKLVRIAKSTDLLTWTELVAAGLELATAGEPTVWCPNFFVDSNGLLYLLGSTDDGIGGHTLRYMTPKTVDPAGWNAAGGWNASADIADASPAAIVGIDQAIIKIDGTYHMIYAGDAAIGPFWGRAPSSPVTGYVDSGYNQTDPRLFAGGTFEQAGIVRLADGRFRIYGSDVNALHYIDSIGPELNSWGTLSHVNITGSLSVLNYGRATRFTDQNLIATIMAASA
jgi:hypothetical protein